MSPSAKKLSGNVTACGILASLVIIANATGAQPAADLGRALFLANAPLYFEAQGSQSFVARGSDCTLSLSPSEAILILSRREQAQRFPKDKIQFGNQPREIRTVRMILQGANPASTMTGFSQLPGKANYLLGNDTSQWRTGVPLFGKVQVKQVFPGVDVIYYADQSARLEYDFVLQPQARPDQILFRIEGADKVSINARGDLILKIGSEEIRQHRPVIYQEVSGNRQSVAGSYRLLGKNTVGFRVGEYDRNLPLVIDPVLSFSTYLGGAKADNAWAIALDGDNNIYIAGETLSKGLPGTNGVLRPAYLGGIGSFGDAFIAKFDAVSNSLVYLTYFGGKTDDGALALAVDDAGNAYVTGFTDSRNFPLVPTNNLLSLETLARSGRTNNAFRLYPVNAFVSKLNASGAALDFSVLLGGNRRESGTGIALDGGDVFVTGYTESTNFNPTPTGFQSLPGGNGDAFVVRLTGGNDPAAGYSTYLGGTNLDYPQAIAVRNAEAYITGYTSSTNFPLVNPLVVANTNSTNTLDHLNMQTRRSSRTDAFVTHLNALGNASLFSTFLGGTNDDGGMRIAVDSDGSAYVTGYTLSRVFPTNTIVTPQSTGSNYASHVFVTKIGPNGGSNLIYSVAFGSKRTDRGTGIALNEAANQVYVTGWTTWTNFFATNTYADLRSTNAIARKSVKSANDVFVTGLQESAGGTYPLTFTNSLFYGGTGNDQPNGIVVKTVGTNVVAWIVGQTTSTDLKVTNSVAPSLVQTNLGNVKKSKLSDAFVGEFLFPITP